MKKSILILVLVIAFLATVVGSFLLGRATAPELSSHTTTAATLPITSNTTTSSQKEENTTSSSQKEEDTEDVTFFAVIRTISENYFIVDGNGIGKFQGAYHISLNPDVLLIKDGKEIAVSDFSVGDVIAVTFDGLIMEVSPAIPQNILKIELLQKGEKNIHTVFESPSDESITAKTVHRENEDGTKMEITLHGYKSKSLGMDFYVKNHEYFAVDVTVTNASATDIHQNLPCYCHGTEHAYRHELNVTLANSAGKIMTPHHTQHACPDMIETWTIPAGESYSWSFLLAAGEYSYDDFDFTSRIKLYGGESYTDGICEFSGAICFAYATENNGRDTKNIYSLNTELSLPVVYTPNEELRVPVFESPVDEVKATSSRTDRDRNGLAMTVTFHGYASESLGMDFYLKSNEYFTVDVTLENNTGYDIHQYQPTSCHASDHAHLHELLFNAKNDLVGKFTTSDGSVECSGTEEVWTLPKGERYTWTFRLAAGTPTSEDFDLPCDGTTSEGIRLYGKENYYPDGKLPFSGTSTFHYSFLNAGAQTNHHSYVRAYFGAIVVYTGNP